MYLSIELFPWCTAGGVVVFVLNAIVPRPPSVFVLRFYWRDGGFGGRAWLAFDTFLVRPVAFATPFPEYGEFAGATHFGMFMFA